MTPSDTAPAIASRAWRPIAFEDNNNRQLGEPSPGNGRPEQARHVGGSSTGSDGNRPSTTSGVDAGGGIETAGGAPDEASVEQRTTDILATVIEGFEGTGVSGKRDLRYGTDIAATVIDGAHDSNARQIVFTPRGWSRWPKFLTRDVTHKLVGNRRSDPGSSRRRGERSVSEPGYRSKK